MQARQATAEGGRLSHPATPLLLAAMLASGALVAVLGSRLTFLLDDWDFILNRRPFTVDAFLQPSNEHLVAGPVAIWKLGIATFGIESTLPFQLVAVAMFLLGAWLLFVWMRRRIGEWPALIATLPVLFLGAAFDDLLWLSASLFFLAGIAGGLGMLIGLDRRDRLGDLLACGSLVAAMLFSSLWVPFAAGAAVNIFLRRRERDWRRRAYIVLVPIALYAIWWLGWGHVAESPLSLRNLATTGRYALDSFAAAIAAVFGLATPVEGVSEPNGLEWGRPLAVLLGALALWRLYRLERIPRTLWVVLAIVLVFWLLGGIGEKPGRSAWDSRYQYPVVVLVMLVGAELLRGVKLDRRLLVPALIVVGAAVASNVLFLELAYKSYLRTSDIERADLAAVEIARDTVSPDLRLEEAIADTGYVPVFAGSYLSARDAYGSPAFSPSELATAPPEARAPADKILAAALGLRLSALRGTPRSDTPAPELVAPPSAGTGGAGGCIMVRTSAAAPAVVAIPAGGVMLRSRNGAEAAVSLRRFADTFPVELGTLPRGAWSAIAIPADRSRRAWQLQLTGFGLVELCGRRA